MREEHVERNLIGRMRDGDPAAVSELAARYGPRIHQLAMRYVRNWEDAEEVTQDVLVKVVRKIDAFRGDSALSSWIHRITFNTAMSRLRGSRHLRSAMAASDDGSESKAIDSREPADWSDLADDLVLRSQMKTRLVEGLRALPAVYRVPVLLRDVHGLSTEEASAILRVKPQTLKSRLHRGRLILRERLAEFAGGLTLHRPN
jgi:RNA polymerase sigma-70 factor (ECF subfamily)